MPRAAASMPSAAELASIRADFPERAGIPPWAVALGIRAPRLVLTLALALVAPVALFLVALAAPPGFVAALTSPPKVESTFARFISAVATASAIAVSVATLTLRREMHGVASILERQNENREFRERVRKHRRGEELPLLLGDFMVDNAKAIARAARECARVATDQGCDPEQSGIRLTTFLRVMEERMELRARKLAEVATDPDEILAELLEQDREVPPLLVRRYRRADDLPDELEEALRELGELLVTYDVGTGYVKTLDTEWGLSRMSRTILLGTLPAIAASAIMALTYGDGAIATLGTLGAAAVVCGALAVALFPIAAFVAYLLRFVIVNQHTLPTMGFLLGPENEVLTDAREDEVSPATSP